MSTRALSALALATVVFVAIGAILLRSPRSPVDDTTGPVGGPPLLAGLADRMDEVDAIAVHSPSEEYRIERGPLGWRIAGGYFAQDDMVEDLLANLAALRASEARTANPELHGRLGLADPGEAPDGDGAGFLVEVFAGGESLGAVVVGNRRLSRSNDPMDAGLYARRPGEAQAWLARGVEQQPPRSASAIEDRMMVDLRLDDIERIETSLWTGEQFAFAREPQHGAFEFESIPEGMEPLNPNEPVGLARTFAEWRFNALRGIDAFEDDELTTPSTARVVQSDGLVVDVDIRADEGGNFWLAMAASFDESARTETARRGADEAREAAETLNARWEGSLFQSPAWKVRGLRKTGEELFREAQPRVSASHILLAFDEAQADPREPRTREEAEALASELLAQLREDPALFAQLAEEHSDCPSAMDGGDLGRFVFEAMTRPFSKAAFALKSGAISEVVETEFGFHIIQRTD